MTTSDPSAGKPYYQIVREVLLTNIASGALPRGTRLFASAVADRLGVSRPPAQRALELLVQDGLISALDAQGYVVGALVKGEEPSRINLHLLTLEIPPELTESFGRAIWERIVDAVGMEVMNCMPFGTFQISESALGSHFNVSRTVVREVLSRLHGHGVIAKDRSSHWIVGPLGARMLEEAHEVRRLLEPAALQAAVPVLDLQVIAAARERVQQVLAQAESQSQSQSQIDELEHALHVQTLAPVAMRRIVTTARHVQLSLVINRLFGTYVGVHDETDLLREHQLVFDHIMIGDAEGAATALRYHLDADHLRARARLKVLSVFGDPKVAAYLVRVH